MVSLSPHRVQRTLHSLFKSISHSLSLTTLCNLFYFNARTFEQSIRNPAYTYHDLAHQIYEHSRTLSSSIISSRHDPACVSMQVDSPGSTGKPCTMARLLHRRKIAVIKQKLRLLEKEWRRRGQRPFRPNPDRTGTPVEVVLITRFGRVLFHVDLAEKPPSVSHAEMMPRFEVNGYLIGAPIVEANSINDGSIIHSEETIIFEVTISSESSVELSQVDSASFVETEDGDGILAEYDALDDSSDGSNSDDTVTTSSETYN